jgi:transposase
MEKVKPTKGRKGQRGRIPKHDISLARKVVMDYIHGDQNHRQLAQKYNVTNQHVSRWVKQFSSELAENINIPPMTEQEQKDFELLKKQNEALKKKLEYEQMKNFALETMVDLAKSELGIDLKKNSGAKQPKE